MTDTRTTRPERRRLLEASAGLTAAACLASPLTARAQAGPIRIGTLTPLTGSGGAYGPVMVKAVKGVVDEVNAAGGVLGRRIEIASEDDQTNPEAGVRAARKLIDVDKVVAIIGTWASSVTTAVAPLCWESKTFLATVSGADSITELPHQGYLVRTQPNTTLQGRKFGEFVIAQKAKRVFFLTPQTPFAKSQFENITAAVKAGGGETRQLVYDDKKPSYRTEIDEMLRFRPDAVIFGGYAADTSVILRDVFRSGFSGTKVAFAYSVNQKVVESLPADVVEGIYLISPSSAESSPAYARLAKMINVSSVDPYTAQIYDQINLIVLAIATAGEANGTAIRDAIRKVSQSAGGAKVASAVDGLKRLAAKEAVDYDGASGPCDFTDTGDIRDSNFRYEQVRGGKIALVRIV